MYSSSFYLTMGMMVLFDGQTVLLIAMMILFVKKICQDCVAIPQTALYPGVFIVTEFRDRTTSCVSPGQGTHFALCGIILPLS